MVEKGGKDMPKGVYIRHSRKNRRFRLIRCETCGQMIKENVMSSHVKSNHRTHIYSSSKIPKRASAKVVSLPTAPQSPTVELVPHEPTLGVEVWMYQTSVALKFEAFSTYQKGDLFCIYCTDGKVRKFPLQHIFKITEDYKPR